MSTAAMRHQLVDRLFEEIAKRHLSYKEAAEQLGVAERTIQYWASDQATTPQPRHRRAIVAWIENDTQEAA